MEGAILSLDGDRCPAATIKEIRRDIATMNSNMNFLKEKMTPPPRQVTKEEAAKEHMAKKEKAKCCLDFGYVESRKKPIGDAAYLAADHMALLNVGQDDNTLHSRPKAPADIPSTSKQGGRIIPTSTVKKQVTGKNERHIDW